MELIRHASYKCYGPNRWITKEGYSPENMYLIVDGHVRITEYKYSSVHNTMEIVEHCELYKKYSFGECAVMFDMPKTTSVQSLSKHIFDNSNCPHSLYYFFNKTMLLN